MIAIIGAGISGLSLGCFLKSQGFPEKEIFIFESSNRCGGVLQTIQDQGYQIETAANLYPYGRKSARKLCDILGLISDIIPLQTKERYLYLEKKLQKFSLHPLHIFKTPLISWQAKYKLLQGFWKTSPAKFPESLQDFFERELGVEIFQKIVEPLLTGIFAGDPKKLSLAACFPALQSLAEQSIPLVRSIFQKKKTSFVSFESGMGQLVTRMQEYLKNRIFFGEKLTKISFQKQQVCCYFSKKQQIFDKVILTLPAFQAAKVFSHHPIAKELQKITYAPITICALGFKNKKKHIPQGLGFLNPALENKELLGGFFVDNMFSHRTPNKEYSLLQLMLGGIRSPEVVFWSEKKILIKLQNYCKKVLQIQEKFCYYKIIHWQKAIPQYSMHHLDILKKIYLLQKEHPLYFHSGSYQGIALADRIEHSFQLAQTING